MKQVKTAVDKELLRLRGYLYDPSVIQRFELDDFEHVSCVKNVNLTSEGTVSGLKGFIAVGTSCNYNEDVTSRGRVRNSLVTSCLQNHPTFPWLHTLLCLPWISLIILCLSSTKNT